MFIDGIAAIMTKTRKKIFTNRFKKRRRSKRKILRSSTPSFLPFLLVLAGVLMVIFVVNKVTSAQNSPETQEIIAPFFETSVQYWQKYIQVWSDEWDLDPNLVATVMQIESCGNPYAQSPTGAIGLFQVMPFHFSDGDSTFDPHVNASRGLAYLKLALDQSEGNVRLAMAAYNGGLSLMDKDEDLWAPETIRYVYWAEGIHDDAAQNLQSSLHLEDWLASGGSALCTQAKRSIRDLD
jgi:hypothetical protein